MLYILNNLNLKPFSNSNSFVDPRNISINSNQIFSLCLDPPYLELLFASNQNFGPMYLFLSLSPTFFFYNKFKLKNSKFKVNIRKNFHWSNVVFMWTNGGKSKIQKISSFQTNRQIRLWLKNLKSLDILKKGWQAKRSLNGLECRKTLFLRW